MIGWITKLNLPLSQTLINRALDRIYDESTWSFQLQEGAWITPGEITTGTITTQLFNNQIIGDAAATAAWAAIVGRPLITERQIRLPAYSLYNVVDYDTTTNAPFATLTLDRPWMEPAGVGQGYMLYQAYYPAPVQDFKRWLTVRDFTNAIYLDFFSWKQDDLAVIDPQRTVFQNPDHVVPLYTDNRPNTATPGYMLFELYPQPLAQLPYALYYVRRGAHLVNPNDTVPFPLTEELVLHRSKMLAYEWAEANQGRYVDLQKSDWRFLMEAAKEEYDDRLKLIRKVDRDIADNFMRRLKRVNPSIGSPYYSAVTGQASVGVFQ